MQEQLNFMKKLSETLHNIERLQWRDIFSLFWKLENEKEQRNTEAKFIMFSIIRIKKVF